VTELVLAILLAISVGSNVAVVVMLLRQNHRTTELTLADQRRRVEWHTRPAVEVSGNMEITPQQAEQLQPKDEYWFTTGSGNRRLS
jgi:hypothetical protein